MSRGILSEAKQTPLAAFYPHHRNSRGGLSFICTVGQNGEPYASSCTHNIHCQHRRPTRDNCKRGWWQPTCFSATSPPGTFPTKLNRTIAHQNETHQQTRNHESDVSGKSQSLHSKTQRHHNKVSHNQLIKSTSAKKGKMLWKMPLKAVRQGQADLFYHKLLQIFFFHKSKGVTMRT